MATKKKATKVKPSAGKKTSKSDSDLLDVLDKLTADPANGRFIILIKTEESGDGFSLQTVIKGLKRLETIGLLELAKKETIDG